MLKGSNLQNISNLFTETEDIGAKLDQAMEATEESIFGVEILVGSGEAETAIVTPPHVRFKDNAPRSHRELDIGAFTYYEGYLSRPFFLPLYWGLNGDFLYDVKELTEYLEDGEQLFIQWLFRKENRWEEKAIDMYASYLDGNDYPFTTKLGRILQDRTIQALNRISSSQTDREYISEVDTKILNRGYRFQLRVGVKSEGPEVIRQKLEVILKRYDSYNGIRLSRQRSKYMERAVSECILTADTAYQILSEYEIRALFGGSDSPVEVETGIIKKSEPIIENIIDILPIYRREEVVIDEEIVTSIAEALKRVGVIKTARIYNEDVVAGVRLTVVQFDIPKGKTITHLEQKLKDIQAALGVPSLGIDQGDEPDTVKFLIPNEEPAIISLRELIETHEYREFKKSNPLAFVVGVDEINNPIYLSLSKLVHLLVAGTTGSGKSVFLNSLAVSLLLSYTPQELRMYMIDPKMVELQQYEGIPHVEEVVTDMGLAERILLQLVEMMGMRYSLFKEAEVKNIQSYNEKVPQDPLPYVVCIVDEYADLKDVNPGVEDYIARLGQKARAAGIHLVIATQRPSSNIISGRVKAVIPNAVSFNLNNNTNYKTVFGTGQPYNLLGQGDGVMKIEGYPKEFQRFQSAIISPVESEEAQVYRKIEDYYSKEEPTPSDIVEEAPEVPEEPKNVSSSLDEETGQLLYKLKQIIATSGETKITNLQKLLRVRTTKVQELMGILVEEGWLIKHESKSKGYDIAVSESVLEEWRIE